MKGVTTRREVTVKALCVDGCPWHLPCFNEDMAAVASSDAFPLGRRTHEEWAACWPQQDSARNPPPAALSAMAKFVASRSLALEVLTLAGDRVGEITPVVWPALCERFGLPRSLPR